MSSNPFCHYCLDKVRVRILRTENPVQITDRHRVYHLIRWTRENGYLCSRLIYAVKTGQNKKLIDWLADQFLIRHPGLCSGNTALGKRLLVPVPGRTPRDHASQWASHLAKKLGLATFSPTERGDKQNEYQRGKKLAARGEVIHQKRSHRLRGLGLISEAYKPTVCDDVYTTGSTAQATMKHLHGETKDVFCIAFRDRLLISPQKH